ncbi:amino acid ABC transporter ATP-binding protein [Actinomadura alba]|uniref:amino acid ABC transporter ATP-binding protein n=1 Tax=Actinomadura alba TaxID=406431 RepID=UPI0028A777B0|nr:amino acid ABC transporter ATP-binding protein [Actinomadura alba]
MIDTVAIDVRGLHKRFGRHEVLKSVDLTVRSGEVVAVMGPSGAGKTTLMRCLNLLEEPDAGTITVHGRTVDCTSPRRTRHRSRVIRDIRTRTAMVFQNYNLFPHLTVLENVIEAPISVRRLPRSYAVEIGDRLLGRLGLTDKRDEYPSRLSGGQLQRVAIARALAMDPEVILFDEPVSALDLELGAEILHIMKNLTARGITMVIVTHEIAFAREVADRVVFMDAGYILEEQHPSVFFSNPATPRARSFLRLVSEGDGSPPELERTN